MKWGVVLGPGLVARTAAKALAGRDDVRMFAMPQASAVTRNVPGVETLPEGDIGACARALTAAGVDAGAFVGRAQAMDRDAISKEKGFRNRSFWDPHDKLLDLRDRVAEAGVELQSIVHLLPALTVAPGATGGAVDLAEAQRDLDAAVQASAGQQSHREAGQFFVVDRGRVIYVGPSRATKMTIRTAHAAWKHADHPVLCRVASHHYAGLYPPVVGAETANLCRAAGLRGLIVQAGIGIVMQPRALLGLDPSGGFFFCGL